ncbi:hypothetical protein [Hymenobacter perfusus]|uniref:Uncharacterized protein n=1 Tax=Hymenobacter perfusus TaxID=1236770 RepID=A0A3R9N7I6_9BACT|nr:hypothetical protein [Hymenobacter perfusus]RSK40860.1 hypothetical protein EI293_18105 [Hymenobacter perfusus]
MELTHSLNLRNHLRGFLIYAAGDTLAALLLHQFSWTRLLGMALVGGVLYSLEVPAFFRWIDQQVPERRNGGLGRQWLRAALSQVYFNPLWIVRHYIFLRLFSGQAEQISWALLPLAGRSFLVNVPVALAVNYYIQNKVTSDWRFVASALFSGIMAVYYALSATWL